MEPGSNLLTFLAVIVFVIGIFLVIGNVLRIYPTFPCAGFLVCVLASILFRAGKKRRDTYRKW